MISKWEKVGEHSYKGFIFFPKPLKNKHTCNKTLHTKNLLSDNDNDSQNSTYSWWNPISWIF